MQEDEPRRATYTGPGGDSEPFGQGNCSHRHPDHGLEGAHGLRAHGLRAGTSLGLQGPTPGQGPGDPGLRMILLLILAQETENGLLEERISLKEKALSGKTTMLGGGEESLFANHLPQAHFPLISSVFIWSAK